MIGSRCWRDLISPESGATVLSLGGDSSDADPMVELAYTQGGSGWCPLSTLVSSKAETNGLTPLPPADGAGPMRESL